MPQSRNSSVSKGSPSGSQAVRVGVPLSETLLKYSAKYTFGGQAKPPGAAMVNDWPSDAWPSGLRTPTSAEPTAAMSAAGMLAVRRAALTNVVERAAPFHSTVAPATKLLPSTVSVNAGPPAVAAAGVIALAIGRGAPVDVRRSSAGATWIRGLVTVPPGRLSVTGRPVACRAETRSFTDAAGAAWCRTANAPATCGAAIEVPLAMPYNPARKLLRISWPGAKKVMNGATFE